MTLKDILNLLLAFALGVSVGFTVSNANQVGTNGISQGPTDEAATRAALVIATPTLNSAATSLQGQSETYQVTRVIDGDTIVLENGERVRYIGIDAPETSGTQCFARESAEANSALVLGKEVRLVSDLEDRDRYGRLLRYVYAPDNIMVNLALVEAGFATVYTFPPNVAFVDEFVKAQNDAKSETKGIWSSCIGGEVGQIAGQSTIAATTSDNVNQASYGPQIASTPLDGSCLIKGNINDAGEKIYHIPGGSFYERTKVDLTRGEAWFCTEEEAVAAGFRKSKR
ncbi:MAG: thermonuclease family protein [Parcubacteria group bacterium]|nr:thermonuclease family protein [Parcubacteria group bacterium]